MKLMGVNKTTQGKRIKQKEKKEIDGKRKNILHKDLEMRPKKWRKAYLENIMNTTGRLSVK